MEQKHIVMTAERPDAPKRERPKTFLRIAFEWALRELMRLRLAVWLLIIMGVTMIVVAVVAVAAVAALLVSLARQWRPLTVAAGWLARLGLFRRFLRRLPGFFRE